MATTLLLLEDCTAARKAHHRGMDVEVRFVEGCPNLPVIRQRLGVALDAVGRGDIDVRLRAVRTDAEAAELGFTGSPTIFINGADPFVHSHSLVGLSCRLYSTAEGVSGSPSVEQLITALLARTEHK